ncbi:MAG: Bifunctional phosphoglucose/phosphomannose isomerase [Candidatus Gottesmanbacteria bacterium GW2011_GWA1_48_13]|uniref:Bifunctional phosphoglucose/phosphomannose isomerase n=1 Tax=Candidatus Gottesmanbacteria bacterium GW2011_GWA1_48_13 TaxID=1618439 RepID=A0A0G1WYN8_9BACT|nr:MAG: Bifunctional phosphoglucose/phosphomannose isomerase [Candidatus Gottesmanbacteria bacterium GW2011_GWA1_48_13]
MINLDDLEAIKKFDPKEVLASTQQFPDQCQQAWDEASHSAFPKDYQPIYNIVVAGMGGSRFTPKTIKELFRDRIKEPYEIVEDYTLPAYVDGDTLVILSSYSGTTEEVISCGQDAVKRGAKLTGIIHGGPIADFLKQQDAPMYQFTPTHNPCGQPRIGAGYLLMGHLGLLKALQAIDIEESEVAQAIAHARLITAQSKEDMPTAQNPAKKLALALDNSHLFVITAEFLKGFGNGFANQLNETAKMISDPRVIPELNHHLIEGLARPATLPDSALFVFFRSQLYSQPVQRRFSVTKEVVEKQHIKTYDVQLTGTTRLAQVLEAYVLGGFTSFYLAMLHDSDPVAIPWVDYFKTQLKKEGI